jgi:hypothetical protein
MSSQELVAECRQPNPLGRQPGTLALIFGKAQNKFDSRHLEVALTRWAH